MMVSKQLTPKEGCWLLLNQVIGHPQPHVFWLRSQLGPCISNLHWQGYGSIRAEAKTRPVRRQRGAGDTGKMGALPK